MQKDKYFEHTSPVLRDYASRLTPTDMYFEHTTSPILRDYVNQLTPILPLL